MCAWDCFSVRAGCTLLSLVLQSRGGMREAGRSWSLGCPVHVKGVRTARVRGRKHYILGSLRPQACLRWGLSKGGAPFSFLSEHRGCSCRQMGRPGKGTCSDRRCEGPWLPHMGRRSGLVYLQATRQDAEYLGAQGFWSQRSCSELHVAPRT